MVRRRVFTDIGYFDSVRHLADEEFYLRLSKYYGKTNNDVVVAHDDKSGVQMPLYYAVRDHTLSVPGKRGAATQSKQEYVDNFMDWHATTEKENLFIDFPQRARSFAAPAIQQIPTPFLDQVVIGTMATCRRRKVTFLKALDTLAHQFDLLYIYLNDFKESEVCFVSYTFRRGSEIFKNPAVEVLRFYQAFYPPLPLTRGSGWRVKKLAHVARVLWRANPTQKVWYLEGDKKVLWMVLRVLPLV